jgi:hypothetical protein
MLRSAQGCSERGVALGVGREEVEHDLARNPVRESELPVHAVGADTAGRELPAAQACVQGVRRMAMSILMTLSPRTGSRRLVFGGTVSAHTDLPVPSSFCVLQQLLP